jgi:hypothetical protein
LSVDENDLSHRVIVEQIAESMLLGRVGSNLSEVAIAY